MFDIAIIGGGPSGYVAAEKAGKKGLKVILFEERDLGGVCLNEGCIPTKTLLYSAKLYEQAKRNDKYGFSTENVTLNYKRMIDRKTKIIRKLTAGIGLRMKNADVLIIKEKAIIQGRDSEGNISILANETIYKSHHLLICTGSETFIPPIEGLDIITNESIVTSRELLSLKEVPSSLTIIGGGVIGIEFASLYNSLGTEVHIIEMAPEVLGTIDNEISGMLRTQYSKKGVSFHLSCKVTRIHNNTVTFCTANGEEQSITSEKILVSVGRRPRIQGYGLEALGIELDRGGIKVNKKMQTNIPYVYAAGDVTGFSLLAHTASREAEVVINNLCGNDDTMHYEAIPSIVYTNPEVACIGISEGESIKQGMDVIIKRIPMTYSGRFVAENEGGEGLCKIIIDNTTHRILGIHMLGNPCSEIIYGISLAIQQGITVEELERIVFPHPTVSEIIKECIG